MLSSAPPAPTATGSEPSAVRRRRGSLILLLVGLLGIGCALALPFAPVLVKQATVTWPAAGTEPRSTTAFFVPYKPAELHATIPCSVVRSGLATRTRTAILNTAGATADRPAPGLMVVTEGGRLKVQINGQQVLDTAVPPGAGCDLRVDATPTGTTVTAGSAAPVRAADQVPEVHAFATDLGAQARGMEVRARARNLFEAGPSGLKVGLIALQLALVVVALALLFQAGRRLTGRAAPAVQRPEVSRPARLLRYGIDALVVGALGVWAVIGPMTADDGYAMMTIRNAAASGDIGNFYHWYNASESPFALWQRVIELITPYSLAPVWLRLPSILAGILTWCIVSRGIVDVVLTRQAHRGWLRPLVAVTFLAWWLPFCMGIRPEPLVALGISATFALLLLGTRPGARAGGLIHLGLAALTTGLCVSVTPSAILVFAPVLVMAPRIWRTLTADLREPGGLPLLPVAGRAALLGCLAATGLTAMFFAQSWHTTAMATKIHKEIGPNLHWYEELTRYEFLLENGNMGTTSKRVVVLLSLALLATMAVLLARRIRELPGLQDTHLVTAALTGGFLLLWFTPSKWSHHFGSLAGLGTAFLVVAVITIISAARQRAADRAVLVAGLAGGGVSAMAAALAFVGPNNWWGLSTYGVPWTDEPVEPLGLPLGSPLFWLLLIAAMFSVAVWRGRRRADAGAASALVAAPAVVTVVAATVSVLVLVAGFAAAPFREPDTYTLGAQNAGHLTGSSCGLPDKVEVMQDLPDGTLKPVAAASRPAELRGFVAGGGDLLPRSPAIKPGTGSFRFLWGSFVPRSKVSPELTTGRLTSQWFRLPRLAPDQQLALSFSGRTGKGNSLRLEFGTTGSGGVLAAREIDAGDLASWRALTLDAAKVPAGADQVRIQAVDNATDVGGWLAVTGPRIRQVMPLTQLLARRPGPVLIDWQIAFAAPCVRQFPRVAHGLAQAPEILVKSAGPPGAGIAYAERAAGSFHGVPRTGTLVEVPSRLAGQPDEEWGRVFLVRYPIARDAYQVSLSTVRTPGWRGDE